MPRAILNPPAIIEQIDVRGHALLNQLDEAILTNDAFADDRRWAQAAEVARMQEEDGLTQEVIAAGWINARQQTAYSQAHVASVMAAFYHYNDKTPRPDFRAAYSAVVNKREPYQLDSGAWSTRKPAHVSHNSGENEWYTPKPYIDAARRVLGEIDLDPASSDVANRTVGATTYYTKEDDGLAQPWGGRVWMNPPYSKDLIGAFCGKLAKTYVSGDVTEAIVLVNNATDAEWFFDLALVASAICFPKGRVKFLAPGGEKGAPLQGQAVLYLGADIEAFAEEFAAFGTLVEVRR